MIELEDFDWRKAIGIIIFALLIIGGGVYVLNDYMSSNRIKQEIEQQLEQIDKFYATWRPPSRKGLEQIDQKISNLKAELNNFEAPLRLEIDTTAIENRIAEDASYYGVELELKEWQEPFSEDYLIVYPLKLRIVGDEQAISKFLIGLDDLPYPHRRKGSPAVAEGHLELILEFLAFDEASWKSDYICELPAELPSLKPVNINRVKIFKDNLAQLDAQLQSQKRELEKAQKLLDQKCELEKELSALQKRIELSKKFAR